MKKFIPRDWRDALDHPVSRDQWRYAIKKLNIFLKKEAIEGHRYHPRGGNIFNAFRLTPFDSVRVVIIGQDPYPDADNVTGIAFFSGGNRTDSLDNIYTAMENDNMEGANLTSACLKRWAEQEGVLLLNSVLTIRKVGDKNVHNHKGWERFMGAVLRALSKKENTIHFMLWGSKAQKFKSHIKGKCYHIHKAPHPTPRNNNDDNINAFLNCRHFSAVNAILRARNEREINWIRDPNQ